jgi:enoyl-CoA hydratase
MGVRYSDGNRLLHRDAGIAGLDIRCPQEMSTLARWQSTMREAHVPLIVSRPRQYVTQIVIQNPAKRNAMSREMMAALAELWDRLDVDADCRCIVLTGGGDKAFCAGADIGGDLSASEETARLVNRALLKTTTFSKPIVAAVNGDCAGGGVELLLSTDIRIADPVARFGLPEVKWSIYPFGGATIKLVQQIGYVHAMDLILTGRLVDARYAHEISLINRIAQGRSALEDALETATMIAANSPDAVQAVKRQISNGIAEHALSREAMEQRLGDEVRGGRYFAEGVAAFREKRRPNYD